MSFRHEYREAWTLGKKDLGKVVQITGAGWSVVGKLQLVDVDPSIIAAARNRFQAKGTEYLAVRVQVGIWTGLVPARAALTVEHPEEALAPPVLGLPQVLGGENA